MQKRNNSWPIDALVCAYLFFKIMYLKFSGCIWRDAGCRDRIDPKVTLHTKWRTGKFLGSFRVFFVTVVRNISESIVKRSGTLNSRSLQMKKKSSMTHNLGFFLRDICVKYENQKESFQL
jgi:hypothetical protein